MHCQTCDFALDDDDNYCRHCGGPVQFAALPAVQAARPPALLSAAVTPLVTGAATVAAVAVARWALVQTLRWAIAGAPRRARPASAPAATVVEMVWYRRVVRG